MCLSECCFLVCMIIILIYFISDTVYIMLQFVYVVCSGVCSVIGRGVRGGCLG